MKSSASIPRTTRKILTYLFIPAGAFAIWKTTQALWVKIGYMALGIPLFLILSLLLLIIVFAAFLPTLDLSVDSGLSRTVFNTTGNYGVTFLKTGNDTGGEYELVNVELEPEGGNDWHYHKTFDENFKVLEGEVTIGHEGNEIVLKPGDEITAKRNEMHCFKNRSGEKALLQVRATPARGLEKTIRVGYGLGADGKFGTKDLPKNPWHLVLMMGYSESYFKGIPAFIQEPLVQAIARIAQWKGEDKDLEKYFRSTAADRVAEVKTPIAS